MKLPSLFSRSAAWPDQWVERPPLAGGKTVDEIRTRGLHGVPVICPHRLLDPATGCVLAGTGDVVPWDTAVRFGLVDGDPIAEPTLEPPKPPTRETRR